MIRRLSSLFGRFTRRNDGVAAIEAALVLPIIAILALTGFDLVRYEIYSRKVQLIATTLGELIARNDTGTISQSDMDAFFFSQLVIFPELMDEAARRGISVWDTVTSTQSGVVFKPNSSSCGSSCTYKAYVSWSGGTMRPCGVALTAAANTDAPTPTTLPTAVFGPNFLIVADTVFTYKPMFTSSIVGTVRIARSYYIAPRYVSNITYDPSQGSGYSRACVTP